MHCVDLGESFPTSIYLQKIGVDTAENEPFEVWGKIQLNALLDDDDKNGDDGSQSKRRPKPKAKAATQKTAGKGKRPAAKTKK